MTTERTLSLLLSAVCVFTACCKAPADSVSTTRSTIGKIRAACAAYKADCGRLPPETNGIRSLVDSPGATEWQGPYLRGDVPLDAWGNQFKYRIVNGKPVVESAGPDGKFDTPDDIK